MSESSSSINRAIPGIIETPQEAEFGRRQLVTWKTPAYGYVQMYINPSSLSISQSKVTKTTRTKAGFVFQYAGEALTKISIRGTTGSAGMEGINILESIYRSEQDAFNGIADELQKRATTAQLQTIFDDAVNGALGANQVGALVEETTLNMFDQPFPTLASLAANIEMHFQGVVYRGFFDSFGFDESGEHPGIFEYSLEFTSYAKSGVRRNFMPWHRQPNGPASPDLSNPLSYDNGKGTAYVPPQTPPPVEPPTRSNGRNIAAEVTVRQDALATRASRITSFASSSNGKSLAEQIQFNDSPTDSLDSNGGNNFSVFD